MKLGLRRAEEESNANRGREPSRRGAVAGRGVVGGVLVFIAGRPSVRLEGSLDVGGNPSSMRTIVSSDAGGGIAAGGGVGVVIEFVVFVVIGNDDGGAVVVVDDDAIGNDDDDGRADGGVDPIRGVLVVVVRGGGGSLALSLSAFVVRPSRSPGTTGLAGNPPILTVLLLPSPSPPSSLAIPRDNIG